MNDTTQAPSHTEAHGHALISFGLAVLRSGRFLITSVFIVTLTALIVSLLLPVSYRSVASILPPSESSSGSVAAASSLLRNVLPNVRLGGGSQQGTDQYLAILKSRTVMEAVAREFNLPEVYEVADASMELTLKELESNVEFVVQPEEHLTVTVVDRDAQRAAAMANAFVTRLNEKSIDMATRNARSNREFIERRVRDTQQELFKAEEAWKKYLERGGIPIAGEAGGDGISAIAEVYGLRVRKEVELGVVERTLGSDHPEVARRQLELDEITRKTSELPESSIEGVRLYRQVFVQQRILEFIYPLYEQAKVDEQRDVPVLMVLDRAVPAEKKFKPRRLLIVAGAFFFSLLISLLWVGLQLYYERLQITEGAQIAEIRAAFRRLLRRHPQA